MNDENKGYGCPQTEMRSQAAHESGNYFEEENPGLDFHMKQDAPHYSSRATRIAYYKWELSYPGLLS